MNFKFLFALVLLPILAFAAGGYSARVYIEQGGNKLVVKSGGTLQLDSGSTWKLGGTTVTATATQLNSAVATTATPAFTGDMTATGSLTGDGGDSISGFKSKQVAATATTITAAQCGSTFINSGAVEMELPEASTVLGCELTFIVGNASNFTIDPDAADQVVLSTNAAGDSLIADAVGEVLKIQAISASQWAPMIQTGTWTDSN